jgi:putative polymerase
LARDSQWPAYVLIIGAIGFNAVLCFLNTRGIAISNFHVMMAEALLISAALAVSRDYLTSTNVIALSLIVLFTIVISALRYLNAPEAGYDPKISRDLVIPVAFFLLGKAYNDIKLADRIVLTSALIVLLFAVFEYFFLEAFLKVFGVAEYYIARGTLEASSWALNVAQGLMVSGIRPADQGRALMPFLGDHRVSSIFLEPISLGNFGTLVTLWAVLRSRMEDRLYVLGALCGLALVVLSDTRFDAYFLVVGVVILLLPPRTTNFAAAVLPFLVMLGLYLLGALTDHYDGIPVIEGRNVYYRLLYSGQVLLDLNAYNWFGLQLPRVQTFDAGYAYVISNLGIVGFAALWALFMSIKGSSRYYFSFRNVMAFYFSALLCISASQFTIKIAALLWFLLGVLATARDNDSRGGSRAVRGRGTS